MAAGAWVADSTAAVLGGSVWGTPPEASHGIVVVGLIGPPTGGSVRQKQRKEHP